jgi:hypothetical protein
MNVETARRRPGHGARPDYRAVSRTASERRAEALVAAYIHELSPRHHAEREAREGRRRPDSG